MSKVINIDDFLKERTVEVKLGSKTFVVKDIPLEVRELLAEGGDSRKVVMMILNCSEKDLEGYGMAAFAAIINQVTENLFQPGSQNAV
jgi:hypothetical protein